MRLSLLSLFGFGRGSLRHFCVVLQAGYLALFTAPLLHDRLFIASRVAPGKLCSRLGHIREHCFKKPLQLVCLLLSQPLYHALFLRGYQPEQTACRRAGRNGSAQ